MWGCFVNKAKSKSKCKAVASCQSTCFKEVLLFSGRDFRSKFAHLHYIHDNKCIISTAGVESRTALTPSWDLTNIKSLNVGEIMLMRKC